MVTVMSIEQDQAGKRRVMGEDLGTRQGAEHQPCDVTPTQQRDPPEMWHLVLLMEGCPH